MHMHGRYRTTIQLMLPKKVKKLKKKICLKKLQDVMRMTKYLGWMLKYPMWMFKYLIRMSKYLTCMFRDLTCVFKNLMCIFKDLMYIVNNLMCIFKDPMCIFKYPKNVGGDIISNLFIKRLTGLILLELTFCTYRIFTQYFHGSINLMENNQLYLYFHKIYLLLHECK